MWQANKVAILVLLCGFALLGAVVCVLNARDPLLARQVLSGGICLLLFGVAVGSWLSVRRKL